MKLIRKSDQPIFISVGGPPPSTAHFHRPRPWATYTLLTINFVLLVLMQLSGGSENPSVLLKFGASYGPYFHRGEYWRLVMPMFLHVGWLHLLVNSSALYVLGIILEPVYGYGRFSLIYVISGIGSSFLSMRMTNNIAAGASGAIFGIAGAMFVVGYLHPQVVPRRWVRAFGKWILPLIILNLILGYVIPRIDNWGHLGGLITGILMSLLIAPPHRIAGFEEPSEKPSQSMVIIPVGIVIWAMVATVGHYRTSRDVERLLQQGQRFQAMHQDVEALQRFQQAARRNPRDERPHEALGALYLDENRPTKAIQEFEQALRLSSGAPEAQLGLVRAYRQKGDLARAQKLLEAVVGKNPRTASGQMALADLLAEQRLYAEAIQHYQQALKLKPKLAAAQNNLAWLYATCDDSRYRNPQAALEHARRAVALTHWREPNSIDTLAEALYANGQFQDAVKTEAKALKIDPSNRDFKEHMARYRKAAGEQTAAGSLQRSIAGWMASLAFSA